MFSDYFMRFSIKQRMVFGYALLVALFGLVTSMAMFGFFRTYQKMAVLEKISHQQLLQQDISQGVLAIADQSLRFTSEGNVSAINRIKLLNEQLQSQLAEIRPTTSSAEMKGLFHKMEEHLAIFNRTFKAVIEERTLRTKLFDETLPQAIATINQSFAALERDSTYASSDLRNCRIQFLQAQEDASRYFDVLDSSYVDSARGHLEALRNQLDELGRRNGRVTPDLVRARMATDAYQKAMLRAAQAIQGYLYLTDVVMAGEVAEFLYKSEKLRSIADDCARSGYAEAKASMTRTMIALVGTFLFVFVFAPFFSYRLATSVVEPISRIARTFRALAGGEEVSRIAVGDLKHEVGELTRAAEIFRQKNQEAQELRVKTEAAEAVSRATRESERRQKAILDNIPDPACLKDREGRYLAVNRAWWEFAGMEVTQVIGRTDAELFPADFANRLHEEDDRVMSSGLPLRHEEQLTNGNGSAAWFETSKVALVDENGDSYGLAAISRNITARKEAELALKEAEERYRALFDRSLDCIYIHDFEGRFLDLNPAALALLGYQRQEIPSLTFSSVLVPEHLARAMQLVEEVRETGTQKAFLEFTLRRKDGSLADVEVKASLVLRDGQPRSIQGIARDITLRKRADEALKGQLALRERLAKIAANVPGFIYAFRLRPDGSSCLPYASPTINDFFGISAGELVEDGSPVLNLVHPDDQAPLWQSIAESARTMLPWRAEFRVRHPKKGLFWVEGRSTPERENDGSILWHGFMSDITERKRAAEQLLLAKEAAEAANRAKSIFLANMSHELRTPLNAILGFSNLMRADTAISAEQRRTLDIINRSGEHLLSLINNVLDMAKIEAGRTLVESTVFGLPAVMRDVADLMRERAEAKGLQLALDLPADLPLAVRTDQSKLRQIVLNLVANAIKFTVQGTVTLRLATRPLKESSHVLLLIAVEDTGVGIASADQSRIFEPFLQLAQKSDQKGTGLGLSITRQFVKLLGGAIRVLSTPGKGSTFAVDLPVELAEAAAITPINASVTHDAHLAPGQREMRILIVEDQAENWMLLRQLLEPAGFQVRVAENGAECVAMFQAWRPHFIWMDWRMPVMDGLEATRRIRTLEGGREVKIAALSASVLKEEREQVLVNGVDDFVAKPIQFQRIFDCLTRHLGVTFIPRDSAAISPTGPVEALGAEALATLPSELRAELADALVSLDPVRITDTIRRISQSDPALGNRLTQRADGLEYTAILKALQTVGSVDRAPADSGAIL